MLCSVRVRRARTPGIHVTCTHIVPRCSPRAVPVLGVINCASARAYLASLRYVRVTYVRARPGPAGRIRTTLPCRAAYRSAPYNKRFRCIMCAISAPRKQRSAERKRHRFPALYCNYICNMWSLYALTPVSTFVALQKVIETVA